MTRSSRASLLWAIRVIPPNNRFSRVLAFPLCACLFAFVLGARWAIFDRFGMDLPEWDQWDAEGRKLAEIQPDETLSGDILRVTQYY